MYRRFAVLAGGWALLCTAPLCAQDAVLDQMYGSGVHAYFSRDYQQSYDDLTSAIDAGSSDPRCYYFRGLCFLKLGRQEEAEMDFEQAARLEASDLNRFYNVGRALERIQGRTRLRIEQYRADARMEAMKRAEERLRQRYGELREAEKRVLESQAEAGPPTPPALPAKQPPAVKLEAEPPAPPPAVNLEAEPPAAPPAVKPEAEPPAPPPATKPEAEPPAKPAVKNPFEVEEPKT